MIPFTLADACQAVSGRMHPDSDNNEITAVFTDSRDVCRGGLFAAIRGERRDGHDFVPNVLSSGAFALVDREEAFCKNTVLVPDVKAAVYDLAYWYRTNKCPHVKTVCVTGSVGKTTTKDMTGLVFKANAETYVTGGNRNSLLGVPLSVLSINADDEYAVLELGMSERGEIERLSLLAKPYVSIITTIGSSHLEALGSIENIKNEKFDILKGEPENGKIILNADNALEAAEGKKLKDRAVFCSVRSCDADIFADGIHENSDGTAFDVVYKGKRAQVVLHTLGVHNVSNALLAVGAGISCGFEMNKCASALSEFAPAGNRQHRYEKNGVTVIADCYNASPESMAAALSVLAEAKGRKIAVLGDMLELGIDSERLHRDVAEKAAACADVLVFVGDMAAVYAEAANRSCEIFGSAEKGKAARRLAETVRSGDTVLFKASNRLHLEDIIKEAGL